MYRSYLNIFRLLLENIWRFFRKFTDFFQKIYRFPQKKKTFYLFFQKHSFILLQNFIDFVLKTQRFIAKTYRFCLKMYRYSFENRLQIFFRKSTECLANLSIFFRKCIDLPLEMHLKMLFSNLTIICRKCIDFL